MILQFSEWKFGIVGTSRVAPQSSYAKHRLSICSLRAIKCVLQAYYMKGPAVRNTVKRMPAALGYTGKHVSE